MTDCHHQAVIATMPALPATIPNSYHEAVQSPNAACWIVAMQAEYNLIIRNKTYLLINLPHGWRAINACWLFKLKQLASSLSDCKKAQWVMKGYLQVFGLDFSETYTPVVRLKNLCLLLTIAVALGLHVHTMDVKLAFLHIKKIYIQQPKGFMSAEHPNKVCLLLKSLYGLKQAPHVWNQEIDSHLQRHSYIPTDANLCVYVCHVGGAIAFISLYVDDCTIITSNSLLQATKDMLMAKFDMTDLSKASSVLGIKVIHDHKHSSISLCQVRHINTILVHYSLTDCKLQYTPMTTSLSLIKLKATSRKHLQLPYHQAVGSLMYLSQATQPDISFTITYLSKFMCRYNNSHWITVKHVICYLKATRHLTIIYQCSAVCDLHLLSLMAYCDSDWGSNLVDRCSVTGYMFFLCSSPFVWSSRSQSTVALSSCEAEYNALSETAKHTLYMCKLLRPLGLNGLILTNIRSDNQSTIALAQASQQAFHPCTKHIDIKVTHLHESVESKMIVLTHCPTGQMIADMLTKALPRPKLDELKGLANLRG